jgi:ferredoxin
MSRIQWNEKSLTWEKGETLLEALERQQIDIPSSCRAGSCHSCLVQAIQGIPSLEAQIDLKERWVKQGLFLACQSHEPRDMVLGLPGEDLHLLRG